MKRIDKIIVNKIPDYDCDLDWLGKFSNDKGRFAIKHNGGRNSLPYFNAENVENMKQAKQNYKQMMKFETGELYMIGIKCTARIATSEDGKTWLINSVSSGGLWGIEQGYKGDDKDIESTIEEQGEELEKVLKEFGFSDKEIKEAYLLKEFGKVV